MDLPKIRKVVTNILSLVAAGLSLAIIIYVCLPVQGGQSSTKKEASATSWDTVLVGDTSASDNTQAEEPEPTIDPDEKLVALTFDDGPEPGVTDRILDVLEEYDAKATFFVVGREAKLVQATLIRAVAMGCEVGNHTWEHKSFRKYKKDALSKSLERTRNYVKNLAGYDINLVRPTYGVVNKKIRAQVKYPMIYWNVDPEDWKVKNGNKIYKRVKSKVTDGDIVLLHDLYTTTADAVEKIVPYLVKKGYKLVTVSELMERRQITLKAGNVYYSAD